MRIQVLIFSLLFVLTPVFLHSQDEAPLRVGLQVGHWDGHEAGSDDEWQEWQIAKLTAENTAMLLREQGFVVDLIPAVVPVHYKADTFLSIHADHSSSAQARGYKIEGSMYDVSARSGKLVTSLQDNYSQLDIPLHKHITRDMTYYYAFNWYNKKNSVHPTTPAAIIELGFMSNKKDLQFMLENNETIAKALYRGIKQFLKQTEDEVSHTESE